MLQTLRIHNDLTINSSCFLRYTFLRYMTFAPIIIPKRLILNFLFNDKLLIIDKKVMSVVNSNKNLKVIYYLNSVVKLL